MGLAMDAGVVVTSVVASMVASIVAPVVASVVSSVVAVVVLAMEVVVASTNVTISFLDHSSVGSISSSSSTIPSTCIVKKNAVSTSPSSTDIVSSICIDMENAVPTLPSGCALYLYDLVSVNMGMDIDMIVLASLSSDCKILACCHRAFLIDSSERCVDDDA
eukprot:CAMPEP_0201625504 /NCGR_PEP_ID=MMETSP0493-20130528/1273_1 /ASSEMBLY_ACC=CAM_ASM_000838 /TAXON_ID=420259 /ORGANISM="Thalassiosira gravida, Strain GMp14c1" /LENGTH=161 /DNA_ID=CAMNT_0048095493 /DNA_START=410 /DNA_END=895 /DNA_ORIENTATION=+